MRLNPTYALTASGKLSRRDFMQRALAAGISVAAAQTMWHKAARAEQKKGGHMRLGLAGGSTTDSLDPRTYTDTFMLMIGYSVRGNLTEVAEDGSIRPEVAESFEGSEGARKWVFRLRKGLQFSNGKSVTVDDVIKSINLHRGEQSTSGAKTLLASIAEMKADGEQAIVFTLNEGNADFPYVLADYHMNIMPFDGDSYDVNVGAGPFVLKEFDPGVRAVLERNPNSYKTVFLDSAEMIAMPDAAARQSALLSGSIDILNRPDLKTAERLGGVSGVRVVDVTGRMHYTMPGHADVAPFNNPDVRLALKYAIDREAILKKVLLGHGSVGNDSPITPSYRYFAEDLKPKPHDPEKARFHLKKAGMEGLKLELSAANAAFEGAVDAAVLFAEACAEAGITVKVVREPNDGYWDSIWLKKPFCLAYWGGRPTEDVMLTIAYATGNPWNESHWSNREFDTLLAAARAELDEAKRRAMYIELQHILSEDGSTIIPIFANHVHAANDKVVHAESLSGVWELDGGRCLERWSMA
jgi:peptide/nickel transport system substrate-binding protein